jgi:hypothetical protein
MVGKPRTAELHPGPGFRLRGSQSAVDVATVRALGAFDTPTISDLMNRLYTGGSRDSELTNPEFKLAGRA